MSELAATNLCLRSRDLTNAVWNTVTNITPALTQIGIDGVASSASLLTSTDVDGVITQAITSASAARVFTAYVKRTIGIGTISMTLDGGSTYTDVTSSLINGRWVRVKATQTVTNPAIGFKISTSGNAIIVDYCQIENNTHETSPVLSVAAAGARQPDNISIASITNWYNQSVGTIYVDAIATNGLAAANQYVIQFDDATSNERHIIFRGTTRLPTGFTADGGVTQVTLNTGTWSDNTAAKLIYAYTLNDCAASFNGAAIQTDVVATMPTVTTLRIGVSQASSSHWGGHIRRILYWPFRINNSMMVKLAA
jgi:hypothetical protein